MSRIGSFIVGGVIGAAIALLYAPRKGVETRALVSERMDAAWGEAKDWGAQATSNVQNAYQNAQERGAAVVENVSAKGQEFVSAAASKGADLYNAATNKVEDAADAVSPAFAEKSDDLREKIEAARERIATQVVKNAEEAQQADIPAEVVSSVTNVADNAKDAAQNAVDTAGEAVKNVASQAGELASDVANTVEQAVENATGAAK